MSKTKKHATITDEAFSFLPILNNNDLKKLRLCVSYGDTIRKIEKTPVGYIVTLSSLPVHEKQIWGESFDEYTKRVFSDIK